MQILILKYNLRMYIKKRSYYKEHYIKIKKKKKKSKKNINYKIVLKLCIIKQCKALTK
jgi:hypothetical protein